MQAVVQSGSFANFQVHDGIIVMDDPCSVSFMLIVSMNLVTIQLNQTYIFSLYTFQ